MVLKRVHFTGMYMLSSDQHYRVAEVQIAGLIKILTVQKQSVMFIL